jgi:sulfur-carrier protein adenylyltransferase/sulfurtransferase
MGIKAEGDYQLSLDLINPDVEFPDAFALAYAMEDGLQRFYQVLEQEESREELKALYKRLAGFEDLHKERLLKKHQDISSEGISPDQYLTENRDAIEGGELVKNTPATIVSQMENLIDILGLGMSIETQSLDLYTRLADKSTNDMVKNLFLDLADEEKQHLNFITVEIDKYLAADKPIAG